MNRSRRPDYAKGTGPNGRPLCYCGCGREVKPPRRSWFGQECVDGWKLKYDQQFIRSQVLKRDHGVCRKCGFNCHDVEKQLRKLRAINHREYVELRERLVARGFDPWKSLWEADHILEVVNGGIDLGLSNIQTLCIPCHKEKTAKLVRDRAAERRAKADKQTRMELV